MTDKFESITGSLAFQMSFLDVIPAISKNLGYGSMTDLCESIPKLQRINKNTNVYWHPSLLVEGESMPVDVSVIIVKTLGNKWMEVYDSKLVNSLGMDPGMRLFKEYCQGTPIQDIENEIICSQIHDS